MRVLGVTRHGEHDAHLGVTTHNGVATPEPIENYSIVNGMKRRQFVLKKQTKPNRNGP